MKYVAAVAVAFVLSACDRGLPTGPARVEAPGVSRILSLTDDEAAILAAAGITPLEPAEGQQAATGGVWYLPAKVVEGAPPAMLAFTAVLHRDGTASGEYEYRSADGLTRYHGTVTCLRVNEDNSALFSGPVTQPAPLGDLLFYVEDHGENNEKVPDMVGGPFPDANACKVGIKIPVPGPVVQGNLQVHQ